MSCCILGCVAVLMACSTMAAAPPSGSRLPGARIVNLERSQAASTPPATATRFAFAAHDTLEFSLPDKASWSERPDLRLRRARVVYTRAF